MQCLSWFAVSRAVVLLSCGMLMVSCSQAPPEPAPEFTLPLSQVTTAPPSPAEIGRDRISAKPAPVRRGATQASGCRHGPRAHCC